MPNNKPDATLEIRNPSIEEIIANAKKRAAPKAHGTTPPDDHISIPGRKDPSEGRRYDLER